MMNKNQAFAIGILALFMFCSRLFYHSANVTPFLAMALFVGLLSKNKGLGLILPLLVLAISDWSSDIYPGWQFVYGGVGIVGLVGTYLSMKTGPVFLGALGSSLVFFAVSNFGVWFASGLYTADLQGLVSCYVAALPFLERSLTGMVLTSGALFLVFKYVFPVFSPSPMGAPVKSRSNG